jgi:FkbM family methyltransferase
MDIARLSRLPKRIRDDATVVRLTSNWREILRAKAAGHPICSITLRSGIVLTTPPEVSLLFLFQEIWVDRVYDLAGFEIADGDTVIDIGGNIGMFAVYAATQARKVRIFSYEPFPENIAFLRKNVEANGFTNVTIYQEAVAAGPGERSLRVESSWVRHSLAHADGATHGLRVACVGLDEVVRRAGYCNLLKVDCEGGEYEIFYNAAPETLRRIDKIVCEYHDGEHGTGGELRRFFTENNFVAEVARPFDDTTGVLCLRNKG